MKLTISGVTCSIAQTRSPSFSRSSSSTRTIILPCASAARISGIGANGAVGDGVECGILSFFPKTLKQLESVERNNDKCFNPNDKRQSPRGGGVINNDVINHMESVLKNSVLHRVAFAAV